MPARRKPSPPQSTRKASKTPAAAAAIETRALRPAYAGFVRRVAATMTSPRCEFAPGAAAPGAKAPGAKPGAKPKPRELVVALRP